MQPSWTATYELGTIVRALEHAVGVPRSVQVHCSGVDLTEARPMSQPTNPTPQSQAGITCVAAPGPSAIQIEDTACQQDGLVCRVLAGNDAQHRLKV